ncbi:hypothetical protein ASPTUDRAFT_43065 [Aspergillus tubingensis CBS 134.48]|uniref:Uncharacterized protein n=1 Tax=Aspergillus tubingensis (strain CBS 134.48) TaxID=767770 RepID=A0A1L9N492_ASPTC|nr:hypothetical protein ASPTUDRAFT_43065 [Aspergillus tubingensis CBS 134.48]
MSHTAYGFPSSGLFSRSFTGLDDFLIGMEWNPCFVLVLSPSIPLDDLVFQDVDELGWMELLLGFVCVLMSWVNSVAYSVGLALLGCVHVIGILCREE